MSSGLPDDVRRAVESALARRARRDTRIVSARPLGGGCINPSRRIETDAGEAFFLKWNPRLPLEHFAGEADGLQALREGGPLRIPEVVALGRGGSFRLGDGGAPVGPRGAGRVGAAPVDGDAGAPVGATSAGGPGVASAEGDSAWLLLELVEAGPEGRRFGEALGRGLAELHRPLSGTYGWERDNYIGSLPQSNAPHESWPEFWRRERLGPQLERARAAGRFRGAAGAMWDRLMEELDTLLEGAEADGPSLVHGDLWSGNVYADTDGRPVLIDPAAYRGHREVDLAMAELFGGFPPEFFEAYRSARPLAEGYRRVRRDVYQLYPLLVHVNLFGASYESGALGRVRRLLGR